MKEIPMKTNKTMLWVLGFIKIARNVFAAVAVTLMMTVFSLASEKPIYTFTEGKHGAIPGNQLVSDSAGNFYGTTVDGGNQSTSCAVQTGVPGCGVVFMLTPAGEETVLHTFTGGSDGAFPAGGVILDFAGNLYGTTVAGGDKKPEICHFSNFIPGCGVVYEITAAGRFKVLYTFSGGKDGWYPYAGVVFDSNGNLYGTAEAGGNYPKVCGGYGCGVVFKLTPTAHGPWKETVLYAFRGVRDGDGPVGVTFDSGGNLYGVAFNGGDKSVECDGYLGCGVVFKLAPTRNGPWTETVLHAFRDGNDGAFPQGTPFVDQQGNVYGTTVFGGDTKRSQCNGRGDPPGCGVVYEITAAGRFKVLHKFTGSGDGGLARAPVVFDSAGNLYSQTVNGGDSNCNEGYGCGVVFELTPTTKGPWTETFLYDFALGTDGGIGQSNLLLDSAGDIFGMTTGGGNDSECNPNHFGGYGCGVVFELTPGGPDLGRVAGGPGLSRATAAGGSPFRSAR